MHFNLGRTRVEECGGQPKAPSTTAFIREVKHLLSVSSWKNGKTEIGSKKTARKDGTTTREEKEQWKEHHANGKSCTDV